jgi:hypothetical protein
MTNFHCAERQAFLTIPERYINEAGEAKKPAEKLRSQDDPEPPNEFSDGPRRYQRRRPAP